MNTKYAVSMPQQTLSSQSESDTHLSSVKYPMWNLPLQSPPLLSYQLLTRNSPLLFKGCKACMLQHGSLFIYSYTQLKIRSNINGPFNMCFSSEFHQKDQYCWMIMTTNLHQTSLTPQNNLMHVTDVKPTYISEFHYAYSRISPLIITFVYRPLFVCWWHWIPMILFTIILLLCVFEEITKWIDKGS